jgi:hypothetical protein
MTPCGIAAPHEKALTGALNRESELPSALKRGLGGIRMSKPDLRQRPRQRFIESGGEAPQSKLTVHGKAFFAWRMHWDHEPQQIEDENENEDEIKTV